jgi:hypothetical protein
MNRSRILLPALLLAAFSLSSCSGPKGTVKCTVNCGGNATVSFTLVADTLPANPSILSFKVNIVSVTLTPTTGSPQTLQPSSALVDLMRLQSDTALLGVLSNVPSGTYTVQASLSAQEITFLNDTTSTITVNGKTCQAGFVCTVVLTAVGTPTISSFTFTAISSGKQGIGLDFNLKNAFSLTSGTLTVNLNPTAPNPAVLTAFTLPRSNANLGSSELELIEDFTGVVTVSGNNVTIASPTRGTLLATSTSGSFFDGSPDGKICPPTATLTCVVNGQIASIDAFLNSDGTLSLKEFEPLVATQQDLVEGIVFNVPGPTTTQFDMVVTDKTPAATNSLIGGLNTGDLLTVNIPVSTVKPFFVDTKGLGVANSFASSYGLFNGATDTTAIHPGQTVSVHVTAFTAATPTAIAIATADTVTLRWSRLIATATGAASPGQINVNALPSYFRFTSAFVFQTAVFSGTLGADGVTNLDGVATAGNVVSAQPVALRALFFENPQNSAQFPFITAKIRQH